jgi:hypothetical protein
MMAEIKKTLKQPDFEAGLRGVYTNFVQNFRRQTKNLSDGKNFEALQFLRNY